MEKTKNNIIFSNTHKLLRSATEAALKKVSEKLIKDTKKENGYLIIVDKNGTIKKVPAKDL
ncbi:MAG TPA: hypothetical protein VFW07_10135 [Parafilimonas sp.]|nr:hypothetical protein [Parafilimonas sp.]